jgi:rubredoxin
MPACIPPRDHHSPYTRWRDDKPEIVCRVCGLPC